jgi:hypothetical protein
VAILVSQRSRTCHKILSIEYDISRHRRAAWPLPQLGRIVEGIHDRSLEWRGQSIGAAGARLRSLPRDRGLHSQGEALFVGKGQSRMTLTAGNGHSGCVLLFRSHRRRKNLECWASGGHLEVSDVAEVFPKSNAFEAHAAGGTE